MKENDMRTRFLLSGWPIIHFLRAIFTGWGFGCFFYRSLVSRDSFYLLLFVISKGGPDEVITIRFSDHEPGPATKEHPPMIDASISKARRNSTTYIRVLERIAQTYGCEIPAYVKPLLDRTAYRNYALRLQLNKSQRHCGSVFYTYTGASAYELGLKSPAESCDPTVRLDSLSLSAYPRGNNTVA
jgi:hypothetical protein